MKLFRTELTATGRPILLHGEIERGMLDKVKSGSGAGVEPARRCRWRQPCRRCLPPKLCPLAGRHTILWICWRCG